MRKTIVAILLLALALPALAACASDKPSTLPADGAGLDIAIESAAPDTTCTANPDVSAPAGMPARPGSGATGDPSGNLIDLADASGTVKEVKEGLVLITTESGNEFMLRFSENTKWDTGVDTKIEVGNKITCRVKPEPTFAPPSQGEVFLVVENKK